MFTKLDINEAIINYKEDLVKYPIYFEPEKALILNTDNLINQVENKLNVKYCPNIGKAFDIPYDRVNTRKIISLEIDDVIVRYLIQNKFKNTFQLPENTEFKSDDFNYSILIDIQNCYPSFNHEILSKIAQQYGKFNENSIIIKIFENCLKISYIEDKKVFTLDKGVLIGSKPDEFFAEMYLSYVYLQLKNIVSNDLQRVSDEFLISGNKINDLRKDIKLIKEELAKLELQLNLSKTEVIERKVPSNRQEQFLELVNEGKYKGAHSHPQFFPNNWFEIKSRKKTILKETVEDDLTKLPLIYKDSINFLKSFDKNYQEIIEYQKKHPKFKYFTNIVASKPTDFYEDFLKLDLDVINVDKMRVLVDIIYKFPKSEYYTAIAIKILIFVAKSFEFNICNSNWTVQMEKENHGGIEPTVSGEEFSRCCEFANLKIVEILKSEDIFDYQKYLIFRFLYVDDSININENNYNIKTIAIESYDDYMNHIGEESIWPELPFKKLIKDELLRLNKTTEHYALKSITEFIAG
jgi:hypothetical protein